MMQLDLLTMESIREIVEMMIWMKSTIVRKKEIEPFW